MTCEQCEREFDGLRCSCGWNAPHLGVVRPADAWHTRPCPRCTVVTIRERVGHRGNDNCKWCEAKEGRDAE
jgi:hypothetical protein